MSKWSNLLCKLTSIYSIVHSLSAEKPEGGREEREGGERGEGKVKGGNKKRREKEKDQGRQEVGRSGRGE